MRARFLTPAPARVASRKTWKFIICVRWEPQPSITATARALRSPMDRKEPRLKALFSCVFISIVIVLDTVVNPKLSCLRCVRSPDYQRRR